MFAKTMRLMIPFVFVLAACAPAIPVTGDATMQKPDDAMMEKTDEAMMEKADDAMMEKPDDAMMEKPDYAMMEKPDDAMMEKPDDAMMEKPDDASMEKPDDAMMEKTDDAMMDADKGAPAWFGTTLSDVRSGETFTLRDHTGKVIMIETLAMWCSNCKQQQGQVKAFHEALGDEADLVTIGLDVDPNENAQDLKAYAEMNGFDWTYAVAPVDLGREIARLYGDQFLNPPSTPILVIDRKGNVHPMPFGIKSADELRAFVEPFLTDNM